MLIVSSTVGSVAIQCFEEAHLSRNLKIPSTMLSNVNNPDEVGASALKKGGIWGNGCRREGYKIL